MKSCAEFSKQCNNDCRNAQKRQLTPKQAKTALNRCIGDAEGSENDMGAFNRLANVQSDEDDSKMTERNRQMQQIRLSVQNSLGVHNRNAQAPWTTETC